MKIHKYQARQLHISVPKRGVAKTAEEARDVAAKISGNRFVVKAQIHAEGHDLEETHKHYVLGKIIELSREVPHLKGEETKF